MALLELLQPRLREVALRFEAHLPRADHHRSFALPGIFSFLELHHARPHNTKLPGNLIRLSHCRSFSIFHFPFSFAFFTFVLLA